MTHQNNPQLSKVQVDLEFLVANINEPQLRAYLRVPVSEALQRIGHDPGDALRAVNAFFNITIN